MSNPPRKRIVINIDEPGRRVPTGRIPGSYYPEQSVKKRRWPKVLGVIAVLLVLLVVAAGAGGFFWWRHYQTTPTYTLAVLVDAAQRDDMATFDRLVDSDKIINNLASQVVEKTASPIGLIPGLTVKSAVSAVPAALLEPIKQGVKDQIVKEMKKLSGDSGPKPFVLIALTVPTLVKVTSDPNSGRVSASMPGESFELAMEKDGETWKIVGLKDDNLVTKIINDFGVDRAETEKAKGVEPGKTVKKRRR
jgi:hypothetical protein